VAGLHGLTTALVWVVPVPGPLATAALGLDATPRLAPVLCGVAGLAGLAWLAREASHAEPALQPSDPGARTDSAEGLGRPGPLEPPRSG
jgi:hypothetical protein